MESVYKVNKGEGELKLRRPPVLRRSLLIEKPPCLDKIQTRGLHSLKTEERLFPVGSFIFLTP